MTVITCFKVFSLNQLFSRTTKFFKLIIADFSACSTCRCRSRHLSFGFIVILIMLAKSKIVGIFLICIKYMHISLPNLITFHDKRPPSQREIQYTIYTILGTLIINGIEVTEWSVKSLPYLRSKHPRMDRQRLVIHT